MAESKKGSPTGTPPGASTPPAVAGVGASNKPPTPPVAASAAASVPLFGGNRGGKKRGDGLAPGSAEAIQADRDKEAKRKRDERAQRRNLVEPPPLPSALPGVADPNAPPPGVLGTGVPAEGDQPEIPWDPELFKPIVKEALELSEKRAIQNSKETAEMAGLTKELVRQIMADAQYAPTWKSIIQLTAPRLAAKAMNHSGIPGQFSDEALCALSVLALWVSSKRQDARVAEIIEQHKKNEESKAAKAAAPPSPAKA